MSKLSLQDLSDRMRAIDIAMLSTYADNGAIASRPMSNNGDVDYQGDSYYFTFEASRTVADLTRNSHVGLAFEGEGHFYVAVQGKAELIRDKQQFAEHWTPDLDKWFEQGIDTPDIVMLKVRATRIHYWDGMDAGEVKV